MIGTTLAHYKILSKIGAGAMGEVYRARDTKLDRDVALKVLPHDLARSAERVARFEREAKAIAALRHPNIVTIYSVENVSGIHFLTMELVEGEPLSKYVREGGLPADQFFALALPLVEAVIAAHAKGVIHRDLKPANVVVDTQGQIRVLDFGLAKLERETVSGTASTVTVDLTISVAGKIMGTLPYMAPEQVRGHLVDARTDLFALGVILYELATGRRPFTGATSADVGSSILRDEPRPLRSARADLPADLDRIVGRCLKKDPRARFQTALDVYNELRELGEAVGQRRTGLAVPDSRSVASIAVLPFVNRSASADDEYFADGLADELLNVLSKIKGLRVTARSSSCQFKGTKDDTATIGRKLNVAALLEGSVRKAGNRIRVSVQLVQVSDGSHLWSETYDRTLEDIFAVQDDITQSVVKELRTTLLAEEADSDASGTAKADVVQAAKGRATDPEAHRLYLLARHLINRAIHEDVEKGIAHLKRALALDADFALAWAELSRAYEREVARGWVPIADGISRARDAAERALTLEPDLAEGHLRLGRIQMSYDWNWRGAESSFTRALELSPGSASALGAAGLLAFNLGRPEEAIKFYRRAVEQNPLSIGAYTILGAMLHVAGRIEEAEEAYRMDLQLAPERPFTHGGLSELLIAQSRGEEAIAEAMREPEVWVRLYDLAIVHYAMGHKSEADAALRELVEKYARVVPYRIAELYADRGEADAAFGWLERAYAQRDSGLDGLKSSARLRCLHDDPRWGSFVKRMGFQE